VCKRQAAGSEAAALCRAGEVETEVETALASPCRGGLCGTSNLGRSVSLLVTAEKTHDDDAGEVRLLSGLSYRLR